MKKEQMKKMERNVHANTGEATCINVYPSMHSSDHTAQKKNHMYICHMSCILFTVRKQAVCAIFLLLRKWKKMHSSSFHSLYITMILFFM